WGMSRMKASAASASLPRVISQCGLSGSDKRKKEKEEGDGAFGCEEKPPVLSALYIFQQQQSNRCCEQHADRLTGAVPVQGCASPRVSLFWVNVPVLSEQTTSTP